ncbi:MAG: HAD-IC family P-type ATPase, partial [Clostridia bacterium]|nr:HAD-IC family P-type ATPase [Clostridia bacterium]
MAPHSEDLNALLTQLGTDKTNGLTEEKAQALAAEHGKNELRQQKKKSMARRFFEQFKDVMILILIAAAIISFIVAIKSGESREFFEPILILAIVIINAVMGVMQESKAEKALDALKSLSAPHARVVRNGEEKLIDAVGLVPGDIILVEAGDFIPADARLIESASLKSEESALTGESVPAEKEASAECNEDTPIGDRHNMIYSGCSVSYGRGRAVVTGTGMNTEMGRIANLLEGAGETRTPLQQKLANLGKYLGIVALLACAVIFVIGLLNGIPILEIFMTAVSLAVSAIPEGLPAIVTIVLSIGVQRMVKRNAIIRRLPAVETLGSASVICSDK